MPDSQATPPPLSRRIWTILPWLLVLGFLLLVLIAGISISSRKAAKRDAERNAAHLERPPINVVVQQLIPSLMHDAIDLPAMVTAWEDLRVMAEVTGTVTGVPVKEGDTVRAGQVLATIDQRDYQARLGSIEANWRLAKATFDRQQGLIKTGAVSQEQFDRAAANLADLEASLNAARLNLSRCTITAPISGVINDLPARLGMLLSHSDPVAQIVAIERLKVEVAIPESEVAAVSALQTATITFTALDNRQVEGKTIFLASQPRPQALTYTLRLAVDNPAGDIRPGMFGRVRLVKQSFPAALAVPLFSVISENDHQYVFLEEDGLAVKRPVTTGILEAWKVRITDGLMPGDRVIIVGHRGIEEGQAVRVVKEVTNPEDARQ